MRFAEFETIIDQIVSEQGTSQPAYIQMQLTSQHLPILPRWIRVLLLFGLFASGFAATVATPIEVRITLLGVSTLLLLTLLGQWSVSIRSARIIKRAIENR
jgi:hypothetical protein